MSFGYMLVFVDQRCPFKDIFWGIKDKNYKMAQNMDINGGVKFYRY